MKVEFVFYDWIDARGQSVYNTETGIELTKHDLHSGSTFRGTIDADLREITAAINKGFRPVFYIHIDDVKESLK